VAIVLNKPGVLNRVASLMRARSFNIESLDPNLVVADARLEAGTSTPITNHDPSVNELNQPSVPCDGITTVMPLATLYLAPGVQQSNGTVFFVSANLISRIQGRIRRQPYFFNYSLKSARALTFAAPSANVWVTYYRLPPPVATR